MLRKNVQLGIIFTTFLFAMTSCDTGGTPIGGTPITDEPTVKNLSVSVKAGSVDRSMGRYIIEPITDDSYYKTDRKGEAKGTLVASFTPAEFILDLDLLELYSSAGETAKLAALMSTPEGVIIPRHVNIVHADSFVRNFEIASNKWDGIWMQFLPFIGSTGLDMDHRFTFMSVVGIDLGADYDEVVLPNEKTGELTAPTPGLHYFSFKDIQPFDTGDGFISYLIIGSDVETAGIQNPTGAMPAADPGYWDLPGGGGGTSGNAVMIFSPGPAIDFSGFVEPEVVFTWDLTDLVQVWDAGTPDKTDDVVTFNLSTPFPVGLKVQEKTAPEAGSGTADTTAPGEVTLAAAYGRAAFNTLIWINPVDIDFKEVVIVRKAGSEPADKNDGDEVYRGYEPNFCDTSVETGTHYYYKIFTVDYSDNFSSGVCLDTVSQE